MMKRIYRLLLCAAALAALASCTPKERAVEFPLYQGSNTSAVDIVKVELRDSATILHFDVQFTPHWWIRFASDSRICSGERTCRLTGSDGMPLDEQFWMPEGGRHSFSLTFEPLPLDSKYLDFIEGDADGAFKIWGVSLDGDKFEGAPKGLPAKLARAPKDGPLPQPVLKSAETALEFHLLGGEFAKDDISMSLTPIMGEIRDSTPLDFDENGVCTVSCYLDGSAECIIIAMEDAIGQAWVEPGSMTRIYIDGRRLAMNHLARLRGLEESCSGAIYTDGMYSDLNRFMNTVSEPRLENTFTAFDYHWTGEEFTENVIRMYEESFQETSGLPEMLREHYLSGIKNQILMATVSCERYMNIAYMLDKHEYGEVPADSIATHLTNDQIARIGKAIDAGDLAMLMSSVSIYLRQDADWAPLGEKCLWLNDYVAAGNLMEKAQNGDITESDYETFRPDADPFFPEFIRRTNAKALEIRDAISSVAMPDPNVPKEEFFETIIAPYRGKTVIVDFWNTWCGPCRAAIAHNEPLKTGELADLNLVWLYIANETSPVSKYVEMVKDIKGVHYRVDNETWSHLCDVVFPGIDGIPSYALVMPDGSYVLRNDFRDHNLMKETLKVVCSHKGQQL